MPGVWDRAEHCPERAGWARDALGPRVVRHDGWTAVSGQGWDGQDGLDGREVCCGSLVLSSRSDEMGVSYEAISILNRTVQRGSRFAAAAQWPLIDLSPSVVFFFCGPPIFRDEMRCDAM